MTHEQTMQRLYALINAHDIEGFAACFADDFVEHEELPGDLPPTKEGVKAFFSASFDAFPDLTMTVQDLIVSRDKAVARLVLAGTHGGEYMGMAPTGRRVEVPLIDIMRFGADGRIREHWGVMDSMAFMQQLGAPPA